MLDNIVIGSYYPDSNDFSLHPFSKLFLILILSIIISITNSFIVLLSFGILIVGIIVLSKVPWKMYFKMILSIRLLVILTFFTMYLSQGSIFIASITILKFILLVLIGSVYLYATKLNDMLEGIKILLYPLRIFHVNASEVSFIIMVSIHFIPIVIDTFNKVVKSLVCRGFNYYQSIGAKMKAIPIILYPIIMRTINMGEDFSNTVMMRTRNLNENKIVMTNWKIKDTIIVLSITVSLFLTIVNEVLE